VRVDGSLVFSNTAMITKAAATGFGLGFVMEDSEESSPRRQSRHGAPRLVHAVRRLLS